MTRLIDADAFKKYIEDGIDGLILPRDQVEKAIAITKGFLKDIDEQPTVERQHGEWEFIGENLFMCTNCGYSADADYLRKWKACKYDSIFPTACPNCGADMSVNDRQVTGKLDENTQKHYGFRKKY